MIAYSRIRAHPVHDINRLLPSPLCPCCTSCIYACLHPAGPTNSTNKTGTAKPAVLACRPWLQRQLQTTGVTTSYKLKARGIIHHSTHAMRKLKAGNLGKHVALNCCWLAHIHLCLVFFSSRRNAALQPDQAARALKVGVAAVSVFIIQKTILLSLATPAESARPRARVLRCT